MKKRLNILPAAALIVTSVIAIMAFQDSTRIIQKVPKNTFDTVPTKSDDDFVNLQDIEKTIQNSMEQVEKNLKEIDWNRISADVERSLKQIGFDKIQLEIEKSMKSVDWNKMKSEIDRSMKEIDKEKIRQEIETAMNDVKKNMNELKNFNSEELKKEMEKVKTDLEVNKEKYRLDMEKAKEEIKKAKENIGELKEMLNEMDSDGLISKKEGYDIEYKNKDLFINGQKQSQQVTEKYKKYFKGDNFKMKVKAGN